MDDSRHNIPAGAPVTDMLTGLMTRFTFLAALGDYLRENPTAGGAVVHFDIQRFTLFNDIFGMPEGDRLLRHIARQITAVAPHGIACRLGADRFLFLLTTGDRDEVTKKVLGLFDGIAAYGLPFEILCNAGIYLMDGCSAQEAQHAVDGAVLAQKGVKGSFTQRIRFYSEDIRKNLLYDQRIVSAMRGAVKNEEFILYYQPQYNHSTGLLIGAEALVRWQHPEMGLIPPAQFIPIFERTGFVAELDQYVFRHACAFLRRQMDAGVTLVPISVNLTRSDLFGAGFCERLEQLRREYGVPAKYIHLEITESSALGDIDLINDILRTLHRYGYTVEMDDFGRGYSSLNILKDIDFDIIKLDTRFFENETGMQGRGGTILTSVVRMLNWLQLPMIAEGVERVEQADFLQSIGCDLIQGYLYSKPLPEAEFAALLQNAHVGQVRPGMQLLQTVDAERFWSSESLETLIFSNYVGGAAIFEYHRKTDTAEVLRVNKKLLQEIGMNMTERDVIGLNPLQQQAKTSPLYRETLERAIASGEEQECENWWRVKSPCCGEDRICLQTSMRVIAHVQDNYIFYAMVRNITAEKKRFDDIVDNEQRFKAVSEQVNIYYWEYTVATHEMRPCFRCMRDLGLPALLTDYPQSAIDLGVFPPEVADQYREWHRLIDEGKAKTLEAVMPLTVGRIPFHVRYTTEFDQQGHPVKAYGSAALVVDN